MTEFEILQNNAEKGDAEAQVNLGAIYYYGQGVEQSDAKAFAWYEKSAQQGDAHAQANLGLMYYEGLGVEKHVAKAVEWWQKSAQQGHADAQNNLGAMYEKGYGVEQNDAKAVEWYEKAARQGNKDAQYYLENIKDMLLRPEQQVLQLSTLLKQAQPSLTTLKTGLMAYQQHAEELLAETQHKLSTLTNLYAQHPSEAIKKLIEAEEKQLANHPANRIQAVLSEIEQVLNLPVVVQTSVNPFTQQKAKEIASLTQSYELLQSDIRSLEQKVVGFNEQIKTVQSLNLPTEKLKKELHQVEQALLEKQQSLLENQQQQAEQKELAKTGFSLSEQALSTRLSKLNNEQGKQIANTLNEAEQVLEALNKIKPLSI